MVVVVMVMVVVGAVGVQGFGLVGRHMEGGLLDRVSLSCGLLKPVSTNPAQGGCERLPRLRYAQTETWLYHTELILRETTNHNKNRPTEHHEH